MSETSSPPPTKREKMINDSVTVEAAVEVLSGQSKKGRLARLLPFMGPAFIASVAYIDPGNFATNISGGAKFGYTLLWVIVVSNLMAMLIQIALRQAGHRHGARTWRSSAATHFSRPVVLWHVGH